MTTRRDRLPSGILEHYLQRHATQTFGRARAARFERPIFITKVHSSGSVMQLCSFQSTSNCNIACVNALNQCQLFAKSKERGQLSKKKYKWAIEMNKARQLYLGTYGAVDTVDHYIQNRKLHSRYVPWLVLIPVPIPIDRSVLELIF
jgi:hypothetical protein